MRAWYARPEIARRLERKVQEATARLQLSPATAAFEVPLSETGAGMGQVLPVLTSVASAQAAARAGQEAILSIEEPESQLPPNAQRALGEFLWQYEAPMHAPRGDSKSLESTALMLLLPLPAGCPMWHGKGGFLARATLQDMKERMAGRPLSEASLRTQCAESDDEDLCIAEVDAFCARPGNCY